MVVLWLLLGTFTLYHAVEGWEARYGCRCVMCRNAPYLDECVNKNKNKKRRYRLKA